jgi:hypothetical protein
MALFFGLVLHGRRRPRLKVAACRRTSVGEFSHEVFQEIEAGRRARRLVVRRDDCVGPGCTGARRRAAVPRKYFTQRYAKAKDCPQGMEREGKVCKLPVAGRYWAVGQPLQKAIATYPVPDPLVAQLPPAPQGYEYLRAGDDILLVSKGGMHLVVDIIENVMG